MQMKLRTLRVPLNTKNISYPQHIFPMICICCAVQNTSCLKTSSNTSPHSSLSSVDICTIEIINKRYRDSADPSDQKNETLYPQITLTLLTMKDLVVK